MEKYNHNFNILFRKEPPVPWSGFWGIHIAWEVYCDSVTYNPEVHKPKFIYTGRHHFAKLVRYLNKSE